MLENILISVAYINVLCTSAHPLTSLLFFSNTAQPCLFKATVVEAVEATIPGQANCAFGAYRFQAVVYIYESPAAGTKGGEVAYPSSFYVTNENKLLTNQIVNTLNKAASYKPGLTFKQGGAFAINTTSLFMAYPVVCIFVHP